MSSQILFKNIHITSSFLAQDEASKNNLPMADDRSLFAAGYIGSDRLNQSEFLSERLLSWLYLQLENFSYSSSEHLLANDMVPNIAQRYPDFISERKDIDDRYNEDLKKCISNDQIGKLSEDYQNKIQELRLKHIEFCLRLVFKDLKEVNQQRFCLLCSDQQKEFEALLELQALRMQQQANNLSTARDATLVDINVEEIILMEQSVKASREKFSQLCEQVAFEPTSTSSYEYALQNLQQSIEQSCDLLYYAQQQELDALSKHHQVKQILHVDEIETFLDSQKKEYQNLKEQHEKIRQDFIHKCEQVQSVISKFYECPIA